jgi:hypothetical protein
MPNHIYIQKQTRRFDRLLCQQHLARRFHHEYPEDYEALRTIRNDLMDVLNVSMGPETSARRRLSCLAAWLTVLEYEEGQLAVLNGNSERIARLAGFALFHQNGVNIQLEATRVLKKHVGLAARLTRKFNYFDQFSFLSMSSICEGEELTKAFDEACKSKLPDDMLKMLENVKFDYPEYRWFLNPAEDMSLDLQCALQASVERERFTSETLTIIDSRAQAITAKDESDHHALYLRIELTRAPGDIDNCLRYLRGALEERLAEEHLLFIPGYQEYSQTAFAKATVSRASVFGQRPLLEPAVVGLWSWDLTRNKQMSAAKASARIRKQRKTWGGEEKRDDKSMLNQLNKVRELISPEAGAGEIDAVLLELKGERFGLRTEWEVAVEPPAA